MAAPVQRDDRNRDNYYDQPYPVRAEIAGHSPRQLLIGVLPVVTLGVQSLKKCH